MESFFCSSLWSSKLPASTIWIASVLELNCRVFRCCRPPRIKATCPACRRNFLSFAFIKARLHDFSMFFVSYALYSLKFIDWKFSSYIFFKFCTLTSHFFWIFLFLFAKGWFRWRKSRWRRVPRRERLRGRFRGQQSAWGPQLSVPCQLLVSNVIIIGFQIRCLDSSRRINRAACGIQAFAAPTEQVRTLWADVIRRAAVLFIYNLFVKGLARSLSLIMRFSSRYWHSLQIPLWFHSFLEWPLTSNKWLPFFIALSSLYHFIYFAFSRKRSLQPSLLPLLLPTCPIVQAPLFPQQVPHIQVRMWSPFEH